jgi:hypothetical protein
MRMFRGVHINCYDVKRLRCDVFHVHDDGLRRGQHMRGRLGTTCRLYLLLRIRVHVNHDNRLCREQRQLRRVRRRIELRRKWHPSGGVFVFCWLCLDRDYVGCVHDIYRDMLAVYGGQ